MGPDYVRLNWRYEVTNGQHELTDEALEMRKLSYCMMLGKTKETE